jgi:hypothetical protein
LAYDADLELLASQSPSSIALVVSETVTASHTELRATFDICERPFRDLGRTLQGETQAISPSCHFALLTIPFGSKKILYTALLLERS